MNRKLTEELLVMQGNTGQRPVFPPERILGATVYYNGYSIQTGTGMMIDCADYDRVAFCIMVGTCAYGTIANAIYENSSDDMTTATALTGADFTTINSASDETIEVAEVNCANSERYLCLRTETFDTLCTVDMAAIAILGYGRNEPVGNTVKFDV